MTNHSVLSPSRARNRVLTVAIVGLLLTALLPGVGAKAGSRQDRPDGSCDRRTNNTYQKLLRCVAAEGALDHLERFQKIADRNTDTRASGSPGYDASAKYVARKLKRAGYEVSRQPFDFAFFELRDSALTIGGVAQTPFDLATGEGDYYVFPYSGSAAVEDAVIVPTTDVVVPIGDNPPDTSSSGCEPGDFTAAPADPAIALVQRGTCSFLQKTINAEAAGYDAVLVFNEGQAGRDGVVLGTLGEDAVGQVTIPVAGISYEDGAALVAASDTTASFSVDATNEIRSTSNVIAESPGGDADNVVMAGAHLDSVPAGPGIQDNGSGSAAILEVALAMARVKPVNKLRFAWWGAEEAGLVGSTKYVAGLGDAATADIAAYLNFDMIASPNFIYGVYDADESSFPAPVDVPKGSAAVEDLFEIYFTWQGVPYEDTEFSGRSDYQAFILSDIPASGLFTGAEQAKTAAQEKIWKGVADAAYDPCYHQSCDSLDDDKEAGRDTAVYDELNRQYDLVGNVNLDALDTNADAIAFAILTLAYSTEDVNGVEGRAVPGSRKLDLPTADEVDGPQGTAGPDVAGASHGDD